MRYIVFFIIFLFCNHINFAQQPFDLDLSFKADMDGYTYGYQQDVGGYCLDSNQRIIIVGGYNNPWIPQAPKLCHRLNPDGSIDHSFKAVDWYNYISDWPTRIDEYNGMYYIGYYGIPGVSRIFSDGSYDSTFHFPIDSFYQREVQVADLYIYPDGRVLVAGHFWRYPLSKSWALLRLNADGSLDSSFQVTVLDKFIDHILPLPNGKFLLSGSKSDMAMTRKALWRIHPDGSLDTTFNINATSGLTWFAELTAGGKILAAGVFNIAGYSNTFNLARFNQDGTIDSAFNISMSYNNDLSAFFQYGESIIVCGRFTELMGKPHNCVAILDTLGNLDTTFILDLCPDSTQFYYDGIVGTVKMQGDNLLLHGSFNSFNGIPSFQLVRLYGLWVGMDEKDKVLPGIRIFPNPAHDQLNVRFSRAFSGSMSLFGLSGIRLKEIQLITPSTTTTIPLHGIAPGMYILRFTDKSTGRSFGEKVLVY